MKKIINDPLKFVDETIEGILYAYGDKLRSLEGDKRVIIKNTPTKKNKVGIVTAGGSGHLPVFLGYVGDGMLDGCAVGNVFASPSSSKMASMIETCDHGAGVLCLYGNYGGDNLNFEMAIEEVEFNDIKTEQIRVRDDVASSPKDSAEKRRGVAGMVYAFKIAGAAADNMMDLKAVKEVTEKALSNIRTMGMALTPCIVPEVGKPTFTIDEDEMEIGMGIHGEPGIEVGKIKTADEVVDTILDKILGDIDLAEGDQVSVMVNGLGATPLEELLICFRRVHEVLDKKGISIYMPHIGEFATSMEMSGFSITLFKLDDELKNLLRQPGSTPFYTNENK